MNVFQYVWAVWGHYLFNFFPAPFSHTFPGSHYISVSALSGTPLFSQVPFISLYSFFSLCSSDSIMSVDLSSSSLILLTVQISSWAILVNFHCSYCTFQLQNLHWMLFLYFLFMDILCLMRCGVCHHNFTSLIMVSFHSWNIFIVATFKSLLNLVCSHSHRQILLPALFSPQCMSHTFLSTCVSYHVLSKTGHFR